MTWPMPLDEFEIRGTATTRDGLPLVTINEELFVVIEVES